MPGHRVGTESRSGATKQVRSGEGRSTTGKDTAKARPQEARTGRNATTPAQAVEKSFEPHGPANQLAGSK